MEPIFDPNYLNLEYFFGKVLELIKAIYRLVISDLATTIFTIASIFFVIGSFYFFTLLWNLFKKNREKDKEVIVSEPLVEPVKTDRWNEVMKHLQSENSSDWRLAIIEADAILDFILQEMGYTGENLGERLKQVERGDFTTIDSAWEAHKVRNRVAHEGTSFQLTKEDTHRVIGQYETVFKELKYL